MSANRALHVINDNAMMHCRKILQCGQRQLTLGKFLVKKAWKATAGEEESTASKRQRREKMPMEELLSIFMEGDSPSWQ